MLVRFIKGRDLRDACRLLNLSKWPFVQLQNKFLLKNFSKLSMASVLFLGPFLLVGCSFDASIQSILSDKTPEIFQKAHTSEVTTASNQNSYSTRGYKVQTSVSYQNAKAEAITGRGYRVYTNVQGTIFKE